MLKKISLFIFILICALICFVAITLHILFDPYDDFVKNLTIPEGVEYREPLATQSQEGVDNQTFTLYDGDQPGMYKYVFRFAPTDQGDIYIKAYELTTRQQLSSTRLKKRSTIKISKVSNTQERYAGEFTIYEGNWSEHYLARIEVWFAPLDGRSERKLFEEIYKVEGWQR